MIKKFFGSIKVAIVLLTILILASIIGTIIPQNGCQQEYIHKYGEKLYQFLKLFLLTNIYHSWWFVGILVLLCINIIICRFSSIKRLVVEDKNEVCNFIKIGSYITHLSILIIVLGGIISGLGGFKEYLKINEKETIDVPHTDFSLRVDDFDIEFYPNSEMPKDYKTTLTIIDEGRKVLTKIIEVNHPLIYKGVWFYQSSYGIAKVKSVTINVGDGDRGKNFKVKIGDSFNIPQTNLSVKVAQFLPDFAIRGTKIYSRSDELNNPAVKLEGYEEGRLIFKRWIFYNFLEYHQKKDVGFDFKLIGFNGIEYTVLQVVKDPGMPVVWTGCGLLMIGLIISFFISYQPTFHRKNENVIGYRI